MPSKYGFETNEERESRLKKEQPTPLLPQEQQESRAPKLNWRKVHRRIRGIVEDILEDYLRATSPASRILSKYTTWYIQYPGLYYSETNRGTAVVRLIMINDDTSWELLVDEYAGFNVLVPVLEKHVGCEVRRDDLNPTSDTAWSAILNFPIVYKEIKSM